MLRFKSVVSVISVLAIAFFARVGFQPGASPCIRIGGDTVGIASTPFLADLHVSFTEDPSLATVRVAIADNPETADFAIVDDVDNSDERACAATTATQLVAIAADPIRSAPVIYLAHDGPAKYRVFVRSTAFTVREAAALIVSAHDAHARLAEARL